jgi:hypothetical protein
MAADVQPIRSLWEPIRRQIVLPTIVFAQFAGTSLWFAPNAVLSAIAFDDDLAADGAAAGAGGRESERIALLTSMVQAGFVVGTLGMSYGAVADRLPAPRVFAVGCFAGALANGACALTRSLRAWAALRFVVGLALAAIYPVGMKVRRGAERGWVRAMGLLGAGGMCARASAALALARSRVRASVSAPLRARACACAPVRVPLSRDRSLSEQVAAREYPHGLGGRLGLVVGALVLGTSLPWLALAAADATRSNATTAAATAADATHSNATTAAATAAAAAATGADGGAGAGDDDGRGGGSGGGQAGGPLGAQSDALLAAISALAALGGSALRSP